MIDTKTLPPSVQKSYKRTNTIRKLTMMLSWGATPIIFIIGCIISIADGKFFDAFSSNVLIALMFGCMLHGFVHVKFIVTSGFSKLKNWILTLGILFGVFAIVPFMLILMIAGYIGVFGGPIFMVIDTIRFKKEKPYIYNWEVKKMMNSPKAKEELAEQEAARSNASHSIQNLKEMLDQKLISEEEFETKKAELLSRM